MDTQEQDAHEQTPVVRCPPAAKRRTGHHYAPQLDDDDDDREATELRCFAATGAGNIWTDCATSQHRRGASIVPTESSAYLPRSAGARCRAVVKGKWRRHVSKRVSQREARDHFANERTFLASLRTSLAFAVLGTVVTQLMRLEHAPRPAARLGFYAFGVPLAASCIVCAIAVALLGAVRFLRVQAAMGRGRALVGGWEVYCACALGGGVLLLAFTLVLTVDIAKG